MQQLVRTELRYKTSGRVESNMLENWVGNVDSYFNNAIMDANVAALLHKGHVSISRTYSKLSISYFDMGNYPVLSRTYTRI